MAISACGSGTNPQGMELARHGTALFPVACYRDGLAWGAVPWHWHTELEAVVVTEGTAVVGAGTERFTAKRGEGFFISSGVLHSVWDLGQTNCRLHSAVFHPRLVGGSIDSVFWQNYIQPLLADGSPKHIHLDLSQSWHREAIQAIESAWNSCAEEPPGFELQVRAALSQLAFLLSRHCPAGSGALSEKALRDERRMKQMLQFIQAHYGEEISTAAIAESAAISESECLRCFRSTIGTPPVQYLKQFRVQQAAELLASREWSVAETGAQCGFQDASYFTKTFRRLKGCTPSEYRRKNTPAT